MTSLQRKKKHGKPCTIHGNVVFSCTTYPGVTGLAPALDGKPQHILFRTTSNEYGLRPPTTESFPCTFHPKSQRFTKDLGKCGMYRDNSFNTCMDRSRVHDCPNLQHTV